MDFRPLHTLAFSSSASSMPAPCFSRCLCSLLATGSRFGPAAFGGALGAGLAFALAAAGLGGDMGLLLGGVGGEPALDLVGMRGGCRVVGAQRPGTGQLLEVVGGVRGVALQIKS